MERQRKILIRFRLFEFWWIKNRLFTHYDIERVNNMNKKEAWNKFKNSGKVEDYLEYKNCEEEE